METADKRVLVIGLDGATFDLIDPWVAQGYLPNLARLMAGGCRGHLASTIQPTTAPAWVTFMTGVNQGKHGLYDFVRRRAGEYNLEVTNPSQIAAPTIFDIASQQSRRIVTLNIPYTAPPRPVNGIVIGGPFAPIVTRELVYPPTYFDTLQKVAPDYFILPDYNARAADPLADYADKLLKGIKLRERLGLHLLQTEPWDLFTIVFMATDEVQHTFWHCLDAPEGSPEASYRHAIRNVYQRIDQAIGAFLEQIATDDDKRETTVIVLSDHGAGPFRLMINLNRWLAEAGYLRFHHDNNNWLRQLKTTSIKRLAHAYRRYLSAETRAAIRNQLGAARFNRVKADFESALLTTSVDWQQTRAYALGAGGNIYINLKGREPAGMVEPGPAYEQLRQELAEALMTMADPTTGHPIIQRVYQREELYHGPLLDQAPDLIIQWSDYAYWGRGQYDSYAPVFEVQRQFDFSDQPLTGSHRPEGILIAYGAGIAAGTQIEGARLIDMAPTILSLLGISPTADMDGRFLGALFLAEEAQRLQQTASENGSATALEQFDYTPEEAEKIAQHLRALGYL